MQSICLFRNATTYLLDLFCCIKPSLVKTCISILYTCTCHVIPVSLTCITCKLFEHIICRHVLGHLEQHKILTELQHGFRSGRSCETQLITTFQDIAESYDKKGSQIDIAVLDFSKAFDTVPHDGLLSKLKHYGIDKNIWQWISNFLKNRKQCVVVDGISSSPVDVDSGVPQGTF